MICAESAQTLFIGLQNSSLEGKSRITRSGVSTASLFEGTEPHQSCIVHHRKSITAHTLPLTNPSNGPIKTTLFSVSSKASEKGFYVNEIAADHLQRIITL